MPSAAAAPRRWSNCSDVRSIFWVVTFAFATTGGGITGAGGGTVGSSSAVGWNLRVARAGGSFRPPTLTPASARVARNQDRASMAPP